MHGWIWLVLGLALFAGELFVSTGFYLFILGGACLVVGAVAYSGLVSYYWLVSGWIGQAFIFSLSAFALWFFFAERLQELLRSKEKGYGGLLGQTAVARETIASGAKGGGEMWGSPWRLENIGEGILNNGDECEVVSSDGLVLKVKKKV